LTRVSTSQRRRAAAPPRRRRLRRALIAIGVVAVLFCAATARLLVFVPSGMPARVNAIVMLDGPGNRLATALALAREHRSGTLLISYWPPGSYCAPPVAGVRIICFAASPRTTQGEAEYAGRMARKYHWRSMVLVTSKAQNTRARLRFGRCFGGKVYVVDASLPLINWPYAIAYEWAALLKALVLQRSC
jgi:hypothetical protein